MLMCVCLMGVITKSMDEEQKGCTKTERAHIKIHAQMLVYTHRRTAILAVNKCIRISLLCCHRREISKKA